MLFTCLRAYWNLSLTKVKVNFTALIYMWNPQNTASKKKKENTTKLYTT